MPDSGNWNLEVIDNVVVTPRNPKGKVQADRGEVGAEVIVVDCLLDPGHLGQLMFQQTEGDFSRFVHQERSLGKVRLCFRLREVQIDLRGGSGGEGVLQLASTKNR